MRRRQPRDARAILLAAVAFLTAAVVLANRTTVAQAQRLDAVSVKIIADGNERQLRTAQTTVGATLEQAGIKLAPADRVSPNVRERLYNGMVIKVVRVTKRTDVETCLLDFQTLRRISGSLRPGMTEVAKEGRRGEKKLVYSTVLEDGVVVKHKLLKSSIVHKPVDRVILVGVQRPLTSRGFLQARRTMSMVATAYDPSPRCCGRYATGRTATGMRAGYGIVAVDPRHIPLGSRLYIEGYGFAIAGDTGGAIRGKRIDLGYSTYHAARRFGRKVVTVHVLK